MNPTPQPNKPEALSRAHLGHIAYAKFRESMNGMIDDVNYPEKPAHEEEVTLNGVAEAVRDEVLATLHAQIEAAKGLVDAAKHFVNKVDIGRARSVESYEQFVAALQRCAAAGLTGGKAT